MIRYGVEQLKSVKLEIGGLLALHKQELRGDQFELDVDWDVYETLERKGILHITTVRNDNMLIGYCIFIITQHAHYKKERFANNDIFFLHEDYRKGLIGYKLLKKSIDFIKKNGIKNFTITVKLSKDYPKLLERIGFKPVEKVYMMEV